MSEAPNTNTKTEAAKSDAEKPDAASKSGKKAARSPKIRVTSRVDGFRRAGKAHPTAPTEHAAGVFSADEFAALQAEPNLIVELL